ncbi:unnamed protein product [Ilex paraguariensis]|uniref:Uncharacterized protein n=1 Tax=Ilex paraguariensis TaxID=185542 RepID=A0ABC8U943_9AQUA
MGNIKEQFIKDESCTTELQRISTTNETINEVKDSDQAPTKTLKAAYLSDNKEAEKSLAAKDHNCEPEASSITESLAEEIKQVVEKPVDITKSVAEEFEEKMNEENVEPADDGDDKINIAVAREETSLVEVQLDDKIITSDDMSLAMRTADANSQSEEVDSMKLEETACLVSQLPPTESEIADKELVVAENPEAIEVEETKTSNTVPESKEKDAEEIHEAGKSLTMEKSKAQLIEEESGTTKLQKISMADETVDEVKDSDQVSIENPEATYPNIEKSPTAEDLNYESEASSAAKAPDEEIKQGIGKSVNFTSSVGEESAGKAKEENKETTYNCDDEIDTSPVILLAEQTKLEEVQLADKLVSVRTLDTTSNDMSPEMRTIDANKHGEEVDSVKLKDTSGLVPKMPTTDCELADRKGAENPDAVEVEVNKTPVPIPECKTQDVEESCENGRTLSVESTDTYNEEEIKKVPETILKCQGVEAIPEGDISPNQTFSAEKVAQLQEPLIAMVSKEQDCDSRTTIEKIEDGSTKTDKILLSENSEDSFATRTKEEINLQKENPRELEVSKLELEFIEEIHNDNAHEASKEGGIPLEHATYVEPQEYVSNIEFADSPSASEKSLEARKSMHKNLYETSEEDTTESGNLNKETDDLDIPHSTDKEILPVDVSEKCEEDANHKIQKTKKFPESTSEVPSAEEFPKTEEREMKEKYLEAVTTTSSETNQCEKINEANENIKHGGSTEKVMDKEVAEDSHVLFQEDRTKCYQEDKLEALEYRADKTNQTFEINENAIERKENTGEGKALEDSSKYLVGDRPVNESPPEEAKEVQNVNESPIEVDLKKQGDKTNCIDSKTEARALSEEVNSSEAELVDHYESSTSAPNKETITNEEVLQNTKLEHPPITEAAAETVPYEKLGEKEVEVPGPTPREPIHKTFETYSESLVGDEKAKDTVFESGFDGSDVEIDKNLTEQEVSADAPVSTPGGGKSIKNEGLHVNDQELAQLSIKGGEMQLDEAESNKTVTASEDGETQDPNEKLNVLSETMDSGLEKSEKQCCVGIIKASEITQDIQKLEKHSLAVSDKQIPFEPDPNERTEAKISTGNNDFLLVQDDTAKTFEAEIEDSKPGKASDAEAETKAEECVTEETPLAISDKQISVESASNESIEGRISTGDKSFALGQQDPTTKTCEAEIEDLKPGKASEAQPENRAEEWGEERITHDACEETTEKSTPMDSAKFASSDLLQESTKATLEVAEHGHKTEEKELTISNEKLQADLTETTEVQEPKTDEEKDEEDEHKRTDSGSDAPVMVEASRDLDVKVAHKKSHNILSGVGSKVKHSIAKVKKAITGKSSHPKPHSPK